MKRNDLMFPVNPEGLDDEIADLMKPPKEEKISADIGGRIMDESPAEDGAYKPQDQWIEYWNGIVGKYFASMPDLYNAGKTAGEKLLKSLQKDFEDRWVTSSTRTRYNPDSLKGTIIHYFGSKIIAPVKNKIIIPVYQNVKLDDVLNSAEGLAYLQTLFKTDDNADEIRKTLKKLSNYNPDKTKIWTPDQGSRKSNPERAAFLDYCGGVFHVYGDSNLGNYGRSHGVLVSAPKNGGSR